MPTAILNSHQTSHLQECKFPPKKVVATFSGHKKAQFLKMTIKLDSEMIKILFFFHNSKSIKLIFLLKNLSNQIINQSMFTKTVHTQFKFMLC